MTVGLVAVLLLGSALLQNAASAALGASVDPASRGIYDILVTADDGGEAPTLLAPNSLYAGEKLLTLDDVQAIRQLPGVDVAAPIAQIALPDRGYRQAEIRIPVMQDQPVSAPESFRATVRLIGDDGLGERLLSEMAYALTIDRANLPAVEGPATAAECGFADVMIPCALFPGNTPGWRRSRCGWRPLMAALPPTPAGVMARTSRFRWAAP
ncbi:hypothetical protein [Microterricola viridarii]|uniref:hypothetical protein n=1 Tax=Microterricola viridarii TaxID=412690 RepID=UPI00101AD58F|nr:hypothetical protein [Microterricola viridarii]